MDSVTARNGTEIFLAADDLKLGNNSSSLSRNNTSGSEPHAEDAFSALLYIVSVILVYSSAMVIIVIRYLRKSKRHHGHDDYLAYDEYLNKRFQFQNFSNVEQKTTMLSTNLDTGIK